MRFTGVLAVILNRNCMAVLSTEFSNAGHYVIANHFQTILPLKTCSKGSMVKVRVIKSN